MQKKYILPVLVLSVFAWSCQKSSGPSTPVYTVPATYTFANVNDSNQLKLLLMADQLGAAINLGNTAGTMVNAQKLKDMFNNVNGYFTDSSLKLNNSGLRLSAICSPAAQTALMNCFDSIGLYSQTNASAGPGVAGIAASLASPGKKLLLSPNGVFYSQVVKKTIQGGIFAYAIQNIYLTDSIGASVDNTTVVPGWGTALEHHWDEAFGLWGVPVNFPASTTGLKYLGSYSNQVDPGLHCNSTIMNAFLKGRAAISNKDQTTMRAQADLLIRAFDTLDAAAIIQEMNETDANIEAGDAVAANGTMSEALGFVRNLQYNTSPKRVITSAQLAQLLGLIDPANPASPNLYLFVNASVSTKAEIEAKTNAIRQFVAQVYGFAAGQLPLL